MPQSERLWEIPCLPPTYLHWKFYLSYQDSKKSIWPLREGYRVAFPNQSFKLALFSRNFLDTTPPQLPVLQGLRLARALSIVTSRHPPPTPHWSTEAPHLLYSKLHAIPSPSLKKVKFILWQCLLAISSGSLKHQGLWW